MRVADIRALAGEARHLGFALRDEVAGTDAGPLVVSGVLAEQLAKELGAASAPGAVVVGTGTAPANAEVRVHVIAGDPTAEDESLVGGSAALGVEVVLVELWPQADWTRPFVLSPFVVECRAGEGFPIREIADRIAQATENGAALASKVPVLVESVRSGLVKQAVIRSALIGLAGSRLGTSRPLLVREQARMVSRLRAVSSGPAVSDELPALAGGAAAMLASGFALRGIARSARTILPAPLAHAAVAAAGTWAFAKALQALEPRLPST